MTRIEHTSAEHASDDLESETIPSLGLEWPQWVVEHLIKLFKRVRPSH